MSEELNKILVSELNEHINYWNKKILDNKNDIDIVMFSKKMIDYYLDKFNNIRNIYIHGINGCDK
jgi:hypothetical protein